MSTETHENLEPQSISQDASCTHKKLVSIIKNVSNDSKNVEEEHKSSQNAHDKVCIFCNQERKKAGSRAQILSECQSIDTFNLVKKYAEILEDSAILDLLKVNKSFHYHGICRTNYQRKSEKITRKKLPEGKWHDKRNVHKASFETLCHIIDEEIIAQEKIYFLTDLHRRYINFLKENSSDTLSESDFHNYTTQVLQDKLLDTYKNQLIITASNTSTKKKIVYKNGIDSDKLINYATITSSAEEKMFESVAFQLRNAVKSAKTQKLPSKISVDDILEGECEIPELLFTFMCNLIKGPDIRRKASSDDLIKIRSLCQDIIYVITKGRVIPAKHLMLGLAMKTLTSSRKVITVLNKCGHSIAYTAVEEIETEMAYSAFENDAIIPTSIIIDENLSTNVAFDNYDRFVDTFSGKDTLHDTVGIIYQFPFNENLENAAHKLNNSKNQLSVSASHTEVLPIPISTCNLSDSEHRNAEYMPRKRRKLELITFDIPPYTKKPSAKTMLLPINQVSSIIEECSESQRISKVKDFMWAFCLSAIDTTPMWAGFNCHNYRE